jgi:hypothetical protein
MRFIICALALGALAGLRPASAAEIKILEPADCSIVRGVVPIKVRPLITPAERFVQNPEVTVETLDGQEVEHLRAVPDFRQIRAGKSDGICTTALDTRTLKDGAYIVTFHFPTLLRGARLVETTETLTLGVRNGAAKPARFTVTLDDATAKVGDGANPVVTVYDTKGAKLPAARVTFKVDKGEVDRPAEISGADGDALVLVNSETPGTVTLTVQVEDLAPVTKVIRFTE